MAPKYSIRYQQQCNLIYAVAHRTARFSCLAWGLLRLLLPKVAAKMTEMYPEIPP